MKENFRNYNYFFKILLIVYLFSVLSACDGMTPTIPVIHFFIASPPSITSGESSVLSWSVTDAETVYIEPGIGTVTGTSITVFPYATYTYLLTASNSAGSVSESVTVTVGAAYGSIDLNSTPPGAKVYLDGVDTGKITPSVLPNVSAGTHTIKLDLFHYQIREEADILVTAGETTYLNWSLTYAPTDTYTLQPGSDGKDASVTIDQPDSNTGSYPSCFVGYFSTTYSKYRTYLEFDLSPNPLPAGAVVNSAYLYLHQYDFVGSGSLTVGLYQVTSDWGEGTITWNNQPASLVEPESTTAIYSSTGSWRIWSIGDLVKGWLNGSITNYGVMLKPVSEPATNMIFFNSSDWSTITKHPKLLIDYYVP